MLKLLAVATRIVRIVRQGMTMFNCMQHQNISDYLANLIKVTVKSVSKFWDSCQESVNGEDAAMLLRLQVEYDHFILRTITTILESQKFGVWKYVSVIPFTGVTEAGMWKVLYMCYNSCTDNPDYNFPDDIYVKEVIWKCRFENADLKNLFHEKVQLLSPSERLSLLESLANMVKSRTEASEFITIVTTEMLELSFLIPNAGEEMAKKCTEIYAELARQHPSFLSAVLFRIKSSSSRNETIIDSMSEIPCELWKPSRADMDLLIEWLVNTSINHFSNRLSRVMLTKINWSTDSHHKGLHIGIHYHRNIAVQLYAAARMHVFVEGSSQDPFSCPSFSGFDGKSTLVLAKSHHPKKFIEWCWRMLLSLKLHLFEQPVAGAEKQEGFNVLPNIDVDNELLPISKGLSSQNPFAAYITLSMTEKGHRSECLEENVENLIILMSGKNYMQSLSILSWLIPLNIENVDSLIKNKKFVSAINNLLVSDQNEILDRMLGMIEQQLEHHEQSKLKLMSFWVDLMHEVAAVVIKVWSSSWFLATTKGLQQVVYVLDTLIQVTSNDDALHNHLITVVLCRTYDELFAKQLSSSGIFSWIPLLPLGSRVKKCDWLTSMHVLQQKFPDKIWLSWLVIKSDMMKMEEILTEVMTEMSANMDMNSQDELPIETIMKNVCTRHSLTPIPLALVPVNAWGKLILETHADHALMPLLVFNFFKCFFASTQSSGSLGYRFLSESVIRELKIKMTQLVDYHHREWSFLSGTDQGDLLERHSKNTKWYRALPLWIDESHLHDAYVDLTQYPQHFCTDLLKFVFEGANENVMSSYMDHSGTCEQEEHILKLWMDVKEYDSDVHPLILDFSQVRDCIDDSVRVPPPESQHSKIETLIPLHNDLIGSGNATISLIQHNIRSVIEEGRLFNKRLRRFTELNLQLMELMPQKYMTVTKELTLKGSCDKAAGYGGTDACTGAGSVTLTFQKSTENKQVAKELERNRNDFNKVLLELMEMPSEKVVTTILISEGYFSAYRGSSDAKDQACLSNMLSYLLSLMTDKESVAFPATRHLFNVFIDYVSMDDEDERDKNSMFVLLTTITHPHLIEYFAPRLVPQKCSSACFLDLYVTIQENMTAMPSQIVFVLLSKFDVANWLKSFNDEKQIQVLQDSVTAALRILGSDPPDDRLMIMGLYRKHLQHLQNHRNLRPF